MLFQKNGTPALRLPKRLRLGLALGSGAARGWAHVGVIQALEEAGIVVDVVAGSSAGAFVGAFYAADEMEGLIKFSERIDRPYHNLRIMDLALHPRGLMSGRRFVKMVAEHLKARTFEELRLPFGVTATDLTHFREVHIREGALLPAIRASTSVPGLVHPLEWKDSLLVDGGVLAPVPVRLARSLGADIVIAVDISRFDMGEIPKSTLEVMDRTISTLLYRLNEVNRYLDPPDILIQPNLEEIGFFDNHRSPLTVKRGYEAACEAIPKLQKLMGRSLVAELKKKMKTPSLSRLLTRLNTIKKNMMSMD